LGLLEGWGANAIFHATGKRIRALPVTPDKLL
jgi:CO/xanthine dehydrogenase Mo-binding subunit